MALYQRFPGPWKRYADAAGGNPDAGALFDHILLRYRTEDALVEKGGQSWIMQATRCWLQEVPLSDGRFKRALKDLCAAGMVEAKTMTMSDFSPTRVTHVCLTAKGETFMRPKSTAAPRSERHSRLSRSDRVDSDAASDSIESMARNNKTLTHFPETNGSELSLAPDGARETESEQGQEEESRKSEEEPTEQSGEKKLTEDDVWAAWRAAYAKSLPNVTISPFRGRKLKYAKQVAEALGPDMTTIIPAVIRDWEGFRRYLFRDVGVRAQVSIEPNIAALSTFADEARRWADEARPRCQEERERPGADLDWTADVV